MSKQFSELGHEWCEATRRALTNLIANKATYQAVLDDLVGIELARVNFDGFSLDLHATGDAKKLAAIVRVLYRRGFRPNVKPEAKATSYSTFFYLDNIRIWLNFSSTVCRRVQVGVETVEQPIYELVCDEQEAA